MRLISLWAVGFSGYRPRAVARPNSSKAWARRGLGLEHGIDHGGTLVGDVSESLAIPVDLAAAVAFHIGQFHPGLLQLCLERLNPDGEDIGRGIAVHLFP